MHSNFEVHVPDVSTDGSYTITGPDSQILTMSLGPGESLKSSPGAMMFMSPSVTSDANCACSCQRMMAGEGCFEVVYRNQENEPGYIGITPNFPAKVLFLCLDSPFLLFFMS